MKTVAAVDLGASSGRVMTARVDADRLELEEVRRFPNLPVRVNGTLHWDVLGLYREATDGLRDAGRVDSIGIDSWAVDYGLVDEQGNLLGNPVHYRDSRTEGMREKVRAIIGDDELYEACGLQYLPFNTIYQLAADSPAGTMLLVPDLLAFWLTGSLGAEVTNASTTGLLDARSRTWNTALAARLGLPDGLLPPLRPPGEVMGPVVPEAQLPSAGPVIAVASHDTASAVVAVPATGPGFAYISCGTWSLVGVEVDAPILSPQSRAANFTNEGGIDGTVRYLRNVMGLWLLQESMRTWGNPPLGELLEAAAEPPALRSVVGIDAPEFLAPGDMPARIAARCAETGEPVPSTQPEVVRCVLDSLALGHRAAVRTAARLAGRSVEVVHMVGGGSQNTLLCQLTADACGLPVVAGPVEATALGNVLVQARAHGVLGTVAEMRALVAATQSVRRYEPSDGSADQTAWAEAEARIAA